MAYAELTPVSGGPTVRFEADKEAGLMLGTVAGWYGTPSAKVDMTERAGGDGSFPVSADGILYSARTVTLGVCASGDTYAEMVERMCEVGALSGKMVELLVDGDDGATYSTGYVQAEWDEGPMAPMDTGTITVVCPDPRRYGTQTRVAYMNPAASSDSGLVYSGSGVLTLPLAYSGKTETGSGIATVANGGTATAYPVITCYGTMGHISIRSTTGTGTLSYDGWTGQNAPVVLDCLSRTASVNGVDVTRNLAQRTWPSIPAGGSITLSCTAQTSGNAYIKVESHDTYI